ncbi:MAG: hypothetical protein A2X19_04850 [Bacteroidetes bacterium GWE2_39_28]|nr:MAG: hypothetical protein A2X19_04850 [Bacteroidetes bacterium GWE2_39_28]OFY15313.1 MAG: hypothetical protein A2X16_09250 [Bacteroidetes bacterium GWF2_39_10]OFZ11160.1 MAG: hypothetical protein A2465_02485 [Bacteroidetes bacterium RIFOXYC2_FULL_39_11]HCT93950.1 hypothetical protein [Rikenellaceae bacterium]
MRKLIFVLVFIFLFGEANTQNPPKREFRGAWFPTVVNTTWKNMTTQEIKNDIILYLDLFKSLNMNAVIFQVRPQADALFVSDLEPWSRFITGEQGKTPDPFFDPAQFIIEECHKRGMEMHAWFNPYRVTSNKDEVLSANHLYFKKPELFIKYGNQIYFDPGNPESRKHTNKVIADFVTRYDVDAVHFDDYFYPYRVPFKEFPDNDSFEKYHEVDGFGKFDKDNWRRNNVNMLVKELNETIKSIKPWVKFGISPFGVWRNNTVDEKGSASRALQTNYDDLFADVLEWTKNRWIDYNAPQLYWEIGHARADYAPLIKWWSENNWGVNLYVGQSIWNQLEIKNRNGDIVNQLHRKMAMVKENPNIQGNIWWSGLGFARSHELADSLRLNYQKYPALMPVYENIDTIPPKPVNELKYKRGVISWTTEEENDPMQKHFLYCIYVFGKNETINIDDASKILAIVKDKSYASRGLRGVKVVVTSLDRLQNESFPRSITIR